jgi:hypothetical protein
MTGSELVVDGGFTCRLVHVLDIVVQPMTWIHIQ